jgi:hypothetical protein
VNMLASPMLGGGKRERERGWGHLVERKIDSKIFSEFLLHLGSLSCRSSWPALPKKGFLQMSLHEQVVGSSTSYCSPKGQCLPCLHEGSYMGCWSWMPTQVLKHQKYYNQYKIQIPPRNPSLVVSFHIRPWGWSKLVILRRMWEQL